MKEGCRDGRPWLGSFKQPIASYKSQSNTTRITLVVSRVNIGFQAKQWKSLCIDAKAQNLKFIG